MTYRIALNFEDGVTRFIDANDGEVVADAAFRQGINVPMDCRDGACGTCKSYCEAGSFDPGFYIEDALSDEEAAEGYCLTCQMIPSSDIMLKILASSAVCKAKAVTYDATIASVDLVSDSTILLTLDVDLSDTLGFLAGQYVNLAVPGTDQHRAYSFSSIPGGSQARFLIRNMPGGLMSDYLTDSAQPGDRMQFTGPIGSFYLRPVARPLLLLAGGTGLAPILSMLEVLAVEGTAQPIHLVYGVTADGDLVEVPRIEALAARLPTMTWASCVADPESAHPLKGFVTHHLSEEHLRAGDCDVYLCGPPPMVEAVRVFLKDQGVTPANFHYEKFAASEAA